MEAARAKYDEARAIADSWKAYTWWDWLVSIFPGVAVVRNYNVRKDLFYDFIAGVSVGFMVVPQGMSYANLAGLPSVYGLYGAFVPCIFYALMGTSKQLAVGPVAVTSQLLGTGLQDIFGALNSNPNAPSNPKLQTQLNHAAVQIAFLAGIFYTIIGLFRLGFITNFLSRTVVSGFMTGAAITIGFTQVKYVFGVNMPRTTTLQQSLHQLFLVIGQTSWREFLLCMLWFAILITCRQVSKRWPKLVIVRASGPLIVIILSLIIMNGADLYERPSTKYPYIKPIGTVPEGLPDATIHWWLPLYNASAQVQLAFLIMAIDMCESLSIAKALAQKNKYELDTTQELRGLGLANLMGAVFNSYTTTGSFSRSAVCDDVGGRTQLAGLITGFIVMFTLLFLTPLFTHLSASVQAAIIITGVYNLLEFKEFLVLLRVSLFDALIWTTAFICVLFLGVELGLLIAIVLSLTIVIYNSAFPRIIRLGQLKGTHIYRNLEQYTNVERVPGVFIFRVDAPLYFANINSVEEWMRKALAQSPDTPSNEQYRAVVLDMGPVTDVDFNAFHALTLLADWLKARNIQLLFANPTKKVTALFHRGGFTTKLGPEAFHVNVHNAVLYAKNLIRRAKEQGEGNEGKSGQAESFPGQAIEMPVLSGTSTLGREGSSFRAASEQSLSGPGDEVPGLLPEARRSSDERKEGSAEPRKEGAESSGAEPGKEGAESSGGGESNGQSSAESRAASLPQRASIGDGSSDIVTQDDGPREKPDL